MFWYCCAANGRNKKPEPPRTVNGTNDSRALEPCASFNFSAHQANNQNNKMLKKRICLLALGIATASQAMANDQEAAKGFVEDSHLDLFFRNGYISRDYKHGRQDKAEWGQAATATFTSGFTQGTVGVGVDAFGLYAVRLDGGKGRSGAAGIDFFKQGDSGSRGGRSVQGRRGGEVPASPTPCSSTATRCPACRCSATTTRACSRKATAAPDHLQGDRGPGAERRSLHRGIPQERRRARQRRGLKSINVFGGKYAFTDHFNASLYASDVEDVLKKQYINLNYTIPLQADQSLNFDFNGYRTKLDGDFADQNFNGNRDNKIWSLAASYTIDAHTFMIAHQRNTGDTGYNYGWYQNAGGIGDGGTTIWLANSYWSDFNAEDERSWQVSYALDFAKYGVPGLTYRVAYVRGDNIKTAETSNGKEREIFNQVQYVVQSGPAKDLTLRLRSSFLRVSNDARSYNDDGNEIRAFVEYPFSVF